MKPIPEIIADIRAGIRISPDNPVEALADAWEARERQLNMNTVTVMQIPELVDLLRISDLPIHKFAADCLAAQNKELAGLRAEMDALRERHYETAGKLVDAEARILKLVAEVDRLDAIRRQQEQDNLDLIAKLEKISLAKNE